jgi:hypothetical protein
LCHGAIPRQSELRIVASRQASTRHNKKLMGGEGPEGGPTHRFSAHCSNTTAVSKPPIMRAICAALWR